jgi:glutathione peroxidase
MSLYEIEVPTLDGTSTLEAYKGQVLLIVNTASGCGLAPQFAQLQSLYETYHEQGFSVLGFPCNQFGNQEPLSAEAAASSCQFNYQVTFPMFGKVLVNGPETHPLFQFLKEETKGLFGSSIKWNFTKFLVDTSGEVIARFAPTTSPLSIEKQLLNKEC